ncbi:toxin-antitoxin system YwqK family antitoxin [Hymenobacter sp. B1770]|uniref:toxin-antitoxin system YwqK family antitoxin n=1 Tax=Hymenobacter sp. B1770 TaxID=1718788 RepID=UPI003CFAE6C5
MRISRLWLRPLRFLGLALVLGTLLPWACTRKAISFNSNPEQPTMAVLGADTLTRTADSLNGKPLSTARKVVITKEQERAAKEAEKEAQRKPKKKKKVFLGEKIKRGFAKSGPKGRNQIIEVFYFLKYPMPLNAYAPAHYYYDVKKRKILKLAAIEEDISNLKILHGPYKKLQNNKVIETGYYALGTRHLRWERFDRNGVLLTKVHYEMGFPRDANVSYYGEDRSLINEVVPYVNGKLEGDYAKFLINGQPDWRGQFENGRRVGVWTKYWGFRGRRHYEYQYGESGYDPEVTEPELIREYNRNFVLIYDKEKNIDKRGQPEVEDRPAQRKAAPRAAPKAATKRK